MRAEKSGGLRQERLCLDVASTERSWPCARMVEGLGTAHGRLDAGGLLSPGIAGPETIQQWGGAFRGPGVISPPPPPADDLELSLLLHDESAFDAGLLSADGQVCTLPEDTADETQGPCVLRL